MDRPLLLTAALALALALALACGGSTEPPVVADVPPAVTHEPPAVTPEPPPEPETLEVAVFVPKGTGCALVKRDARKADDPGKVLAWWEGTCPSDRTVLMVGDGAQVAVTDMEEGWSAILNLGDQHGYVVPELEGMEMLGFSSGKPVALASTWVDPETDPDKEEAWVSVGEERLEVDYGELDYAVGFVLCTVHELKDSAWTQVEAKVVGLPEGVGSPFCEGVTEQASDLGQGPVPLAFTGGHGHFLDPVSDAEGLPSPGDYVEWFEGPTSDYALTGMWLEGHSMSTPLYFKGEQGWRPVEGLGEPGSSLAMEPQDDLFIACAHGQRGVFSVSTAQPLWWEDGSCALWWPLEGL